MVNEYVSRAGPAVLDAAYALCVEPSRPRGNGKNGFRQHSCSNHQSRRVLKEAMNSQRVQITLSEPWDLGEKLQWESLQGELLQLVDHDGEGRALVRLDRALDHSGGVCKHIVASPRHRGSSIAAIQTGAKVVCAFVCVSEDQAESGDPFNTSSWRGGLSFIGDLTLVSQAQSGR